MMAMNNATASRMQRIDRIATEYRTNLFRRLTSVDWRRRNNIRVSYGARIGDRYASLASKGNSNT